MKHSPARHSKFSGMKHFKPNTILPIRLLDLHQETEWVETTVFLAERNEDTVRMPKIVLDCPCTLSVAIAKTHDAGCRNARYEEYDYGHLA